MAIAEQKLRALLELGIESISRPPGAHRTALLAALKCVADSTGRRIGNEAVQLHGGMGVNDELNISHFACRLATIRAELASADVHRQRFSADIDLAKIRSCKIPPLLLNGANRCADSLSNIYREFSPALSGGAKAIRNRAPVRTWRA